MSTYTPDSNKIVHNVDVDFKRREIIKPIHLVQYDDSLPILAVSLYSDGQTYTIPDSADVSIRVGKSDRTFVYNKSLGYNQPKNIAYFEITQQMTALNGDVKAVVEVNDNGNVACSSYIIFDIDRNPVQEDMIESTDEFTTIVEMKDIAVKSSSAAKASETNASRSETNAKTSESNAKKSETNAATSASNSEYSAKQSAEYSNNAKVSENNAKTSETNAKLFETNAATSAEIAASYNGARYVECSNARTDINKVVTVEDFELKVGAHVFVKFTDTGTTDPDSGNFTLNINNTGAKPIYCSGPNYAEVPYTSAYFFSNNRCEEFLYDGERWLWTNYGYNSDTKNTVDSTNKADTKMFLVGADSQSSYATTNSNSGCYIGSDNELYSNDKKIAKNEDVIDLKMLGWNVPSECPIKNEVRSGQFVQKVCRIELGNLVWNEYLEGDVRFYHANISRVKPSGQAYSKDFILKSTYAEMIATNNSFTLHIDDQIRIRCDTYSDVTSFKNAMYGKYVYCELRTEKVMNIDGNEIVETINSNLFNKIYPIGSIYMSVSSTNPSTLFGGTWIAWGNGRVPVGVNTSDSNFNVVEKTGGSSTHTLTVDEIPSHSHSTDICQNTGGSTLQYSPTTGNMTTRMKTDLTGGGQAHNNLQPYITCYMWKRTA